MKQHTINNKFKCLGQTRNILQCKEIQKVLILLNEILIKTLNEEQDYW